MYANPQYASIEYDYGRQTTVSVKHLIPGPALVNKNELTEMPITKHDINVNNCSLLSDNNNTTHTADATVRGYTPHEANLFLLHTL